MSRELQAAFQQVWSDEDHKGVIRCRGRLEYADLPMEAKEPILLPKDHHLTFLEI